MKYIPTFKDRKHSEETKRKMSESHKGKKFTKEHRENLSKSMKNSEKNKKMIKKLQKINVGRKLSEEHKQKIKENMKGKHIGKNNPFYGRNHTEEIKRKISESTKGKNHPHWGKRGEECSWYGRKANDEEKEMRRQMVLGEKNPMYGKTPWSKGLTKETDKRVKNISEKLKGRKCTWGDKVSKARIGKYAGENHPNWQGGLKDNPYGLEYNEKLREFIRERNRRRCVLCYGREKNRKLQVHHIDYDKTNNIPMNLVSLCLGCHVKTNYNREYWQTFFSDFMWFISQHPTNYEERKCRTQPLQTSEASQILTSLIQR